MADLKQDWNTNQAYDSLSGAFSLGASETASDRFRQEAYSPRILSLWQDTLQSGADNNLIRSGQQADSSANLCTDVFNYIGGCRGCGGAGCDSCNGGKRPGRENSGCSCGGAGCDSCSGDSCERGSCCSCGGSGCSSCGGQRTDARVQAGAARAGSCEDGDCDGGNGDEKGDEDADDLDNGGCDGGEGGGGGGGCGGGRGPLRNILRFALGAVFRRRLFR